MKRYVLLAVVLVTFICFNSCTVQTEKQPLMYISLRHNEADNNIHSFNWYVEDRSAAKNDIFTFEKGDIINYKIENSVNGKKYTKDKQDESTIILKKDQLYQKTVKLRLVEKGHYTAEFWATSKEGIQGEMEIEFDIK